MDMGETRRGPAPGWFRIASWATLAWMLLGAANYLFQVTLDPATLPADQQALLAAVPDWMLSFFAIAVWVGLAGGVLLVMGRKAAHALLIASAVACAVQFSAYFLHPPLRGVVEGGGLLIPALILAITVGIAVLAGVGARRGWLK